MCPGLRETLINMTIQLEHNHRALGLAILSALRNAAKDATFMLAAVAAKSAALEYRNDAPRNTKPEAPKCPTCANWIVI